MKRVCKLFIFLILFIPIFINASVTYNDAIKYANNYIHLNDFPNYKNYFEVSKTMPYYYKNNAFIKDTSSYKNVGFLNKIEFDITNIGGNSYLSPGIDYWTMTPSSAYKNWVVNVGLEQRAIDSKSRVRVTQFTKSDVKVSGSGTYGDPWEFLEISNAHLQSSNPSRGLLGEFDCSNKKEQITIYKVGNSPSIFFACPSVGFRYRSSSCSISANAGSENKYTLNFTKNNVICAINFGYSTYKVTLSSGVGSDKVVYRATSHNLWFSDGYGDKSITSVGIPSKSGYSFEGYYTGTNGSGKKIIDSSGKFVSYDVNSNTTLYAYLKAKSYNVALNGNGATTVGTSSVTATYNSAMPNITKPSRVYKVTFNANGGSVSTANLSSTYTFNGYYYNSTQYYNSAGASAKNWDIVSDATLTADWTSKSITLPTPTRNNYTFLGWYTAASGGTQIGLGGATYTPTKSITLYAQWKNCRVENYCPNGGTLSGTRCSWGQSSPCPSGTTSSSKCSFSCGKMSGSNYTSCSGSGSCNSFSCKAGGTTLSYPGDCSRTIKYTCSYTAHTRTVCD